MDYAIEFENMVDNKYMIFDEEHVKKLMKKALENELKCLGLN